MKKIIISLTLVAVAVVFGSILISRALSPDRIITIIPDLIGEYEVDLDATFSERYKEYAIKNGEEITWWEEYSSMDALTEASKIYDIPFANVNFKWKSYIASFGRRIVDIQYENNRNNAYQSYIPTFTFEEKYQGNMMFLYSMDEVGFLPPDLDCNAMYKMVDGKRSHF